MKHTLWIEKYRPKVLEEYLGNEELKSRIADCISKNDIPHFLFTGGAGGGKTTLAKLIVKNIDCDYIYLNASDENGIDMIRDKVKIFASSATFQPLKVVILDEADFLTQPAQAALRNLIEEFSVSTRFILTCNYIDKLIEPIQSRCEIHKIEVADIKSIAKHVCNNILDKENIEYKLEDIAPLIKDYYPDIRSIIKNLQASIKDKKFNTKLVKASYHSEVLNILINPGKNAFTQIRQIIANSNVDDYQPLIEYLFKNIDKFAKGYEAEIIIELDNHQYFQKSVPDKEINIASMFSKILKILNNKQLLKG